MAVKRKDPVTKKNLRTGESVRKDGSYSFRKMINDKQYNFYAPTLDGLREKEEKFLNDIKDGINPEKAKMTLNQLIQVYLDSKLKLRPTTKNNYIYIWNKDIKETIGLKPINTIHKSDIIGFYTRLTKKGYKSGTIGTYQNFLFPAFEVAVEDDAIRKNPCKGAIKNFTCDDRTEKIALTIEEQRELLDFVKKSETYNIYHPMITIFLSTACRCGEMLGLTWKDVDLKNKTVDINHQLIYKPINGVTKFRLEKPKTRKGKRTIPMTNECLIAFQQQKGQQFKRGIDRTVEVDGLKGFVFTTREGKPMQPNCFNRVLDNIVKAYNKTEEINAKDEKREIKLMPHLSAHSLRHTACTRLIEAGVSVDVVQSLMGHENVSTTLDIYNHVTENKQVSEMKKVEEYLETM